MPRSVRVIGLVGASELTAARTADEGYTVFRRIAPDAADSERRARALLAADAPGTLVGEHQSAPFPVAAARLARAAIVGIVTLGTRAPDAFPRRYRIDDEVSWRVPGDGVVRLGDRLTSVVTAGNLGGNLRVAVPTGVVEVVRVGQGMARGVVRSQFAVIADGQPLLPVASQAAPWIAADGVRAPELNARVRWVQEAGRLLTPQGFVLLDVGAGHGVHPGDRFVLHRRPGRGGATGEVVAVARVVRVEASYSAARISDLREADGAPDRLLARRVARTEVTEPRAVLP
ncbi:MAG: hypothetical protein KJT01_00440 [Gemmatimonadetes bacterium]|nr:hypothetical protein [Gemmatimonadota bacterium]